MTNSTNMKLATALSAFNDFLAGPYLLGFIILFIGLYMTHPVIVGAGALLVVSVLSIAMFLALR